MTKIMLIEDDDTMVSLLTTLLGIEGYEVVAFQGNGEILSAIQQEMPDVILLDVNLKNMGITQISGFDLLASIRADVTLAKTGVIMSSGIDYRVQSKEAGADGFMLKPYMPDDLINLIKSTLN